jgi:hypothetical protein
MVDEASFRPSLFALCSKIEDFGSCGWITSSTFQVEVKLHLKTRALFTSNTSTVIYTIMKWIAESKKNENAQELI